MGINLLRNTLPWMNILLSILYLKQCFFLGDEAKVLNLQMVAYIPFMHLLWFCSLFFWSLWVNEKGYSKLFPTIFVIALILVPVGVLFISKDIYFSLPIFIGVLEPLKNRLLYKNVENKQDSSRIFLLIASFILLFISALVSSWIGLKNEIFLFGFLYYLFLFFFESRWAKFLITEKSTNVRSNN